MLCATVRVSQTSLTIFTTMLIRPTLVSSKKRNTLESSTGSRMPAVSIFVVVMVVKLFCVDSFVGVETSSVIMCGWAAGPLTIMCTH
jgi:hypothetical protein